MTDDPAVEAAREAVIQAAKKWCKTDHENVRLWQDAEYSLFGAVQNLIKAEKTANQLSEGNR